MNLLIVDDEESLRDFLTIVFEEEGWNVSTAESVGAGVAAIDRFSPDVVLCDLMMQDGSGLDLLRETRETNPDLPFVMITAYTSTKSAIAALKAGAFDYVAKPFDVDELKIIVKKAIERRDLESENLYLRETLEQRITFASLIGRSRKMQEIFQLIERVSGTGSTVLLTGESGTGKELVARAIHAHSGRRGRFVSINCGAMPENLLESELFGHELGAFTGATRDKQGLFEEANGGTIFLDEIGEMSLPMQIKLLRVLQEKTIRRVGGNEESAIDARVLAATNRDLARAIEDGTFREDLFYRINVIPITIPPLRERREDIPVMVEHFIVKYSESAGVEPRRVSVDAMESLESWGWPGNVRELENVIERIVALDPSDVITRASLPVQIAQSHGRELVSTHHLPDRGLDLENYLESAGRTLMLQALEKAGGVQKEAAELLGMSFRSFRYYAGKYGLKDEWKRIRAEQAESEEDS